MTRLYNFLIKKIEKDVMNLIQRCESDFDEEQL